MKVLLVLSKLIIGIMITTTRGVTTTKTIMAAISSNTKWPMMVSRSLRREVSSKIQAPLLTTRVEDRELLAVLKTSLEDRAEAASVGRGDNTKI